MKISAILMIQILSIGKIISDRYCVISSNKLSCTYNHSEDPSLSIQTHDIRSLDLSGTIIRDTVKSLTEGYINLEELNLSSCGVTQLHNSTFAELPKLMKLNLSDNLIENVDTNPFKKLYSLKVLILSNNLLRSLDDFDLAGLPMLKVLDISGNQLEYLPEKIMDKLLNDPTFSLYSTKNPWKCGNSKWKKFLQIYEGLKRRFCYSEDFVYLSTTRNRTFEFKGDPYVIREKCGIISCKYWIIGSVWIGVILGNVNKLNRLLYQSKCRRKKDNIEKAVGTETEVHNLMKQEKFTAHIVEETELKGKT